MSRKTMRILTAIAGFAAVIPQFSHAQQSAAPMATASGFSGNLTYADIADLSAGTPLVAKVQVRKVARLKPDQAPGLRAGMARVYIEGRTSALLIGEGLGESIRFLADVPLTPKGDLPKLRKAETIVFARAVPERPGEIQLVAPDGMIAWSQPVEDRVRGILRELVAPGAAPAIIGVREAAHVRGNLVGEGETQIFLATPSGQPVSISVLRRPEAPPTWGVSLGEIVDQAAVPPTRDTLTWYRLACFLPNGVTPSTVLPGDDIDRRRAAEDYRYVRGELGACPRNRPEAYRR